MHLSRKDRRTLEKFVDDEDELSHYRCQAALTLAQWHLGLHKEEQTGGTGLEDKEVSADYCRQLIGLI